MTRGDSTNEEKKWLCGHCDFGWDLLGEFCCNKHGNEVCPYPCTECSDFKETDMDEEKKKKLNDAIKLLRDECKKHNQCWSCPLYFATRECDIKPVVWQDID